MLTDSRILTIGPACTVNVRICKGTFGESRDAPSAALLPEAICICQAKPSYLLSISSAMISFEYGGTLWVHVGNYEDSMSDPLLSELCAIWSVFAVL